MSAYKAEAELCATAAKLLVRGAIQKIVQLEEEEALLQVCCCTLGFLHCSSNYGKHVALCPVNGSMLRNKTVKFCHRRTLE